MLIRSIKQTRMAKFIVNDLNGVHVWSTSSGGGGDDDATAELLTTLDNGDQKPLNILVSPNGQYLAILFKDMVRVFIHDQLDTATMEFSIENVKNMEFSPKSTMIQLFSPFAQQQNPTANLKVFDLRKNGQLIHGISQYIF